MSSSRGSSPVPSARRGPCSMLELARELLAGEEAWLVGGAVRDESLGRPVVDDPLRLLRAVRLEDELGFRLEPRTERLVGERAELVTRPAGERILGELARLSVAGWLRLAELGLLERLDGSLERADRAGALD